MAIPRHDARHKVKCSDGLNYLISMYAYNGERIEVMCSTDLQRKHIIEMFKDIKEKGQVKYKINSCQIGPEPKPGSLCKPKPVFKNVSKITRLPDGSGFFTATI